ncbi:MFS transporter [Corynebacterium simulans]|uniref:MFS transporter n=1 Tax=Corynebacterium simulans TaxID=146827 RepID=UPI0025515522|nr:MFS transporter [Corynebacterium simulans]MDK7139947.1 MFS transporter [Corynebacterium simulans]
MMGRLWPFVVGSVALGLDAYVVAGLLPAIASSLDAREATVGLGVAAFTGSYAVAGPLLAGRAGQRSRQSLIVSLLVFTVANLATALSPTVSVFLGARVVAGAAAGVYSPLSSAVAAEIAGKGRRGRALALVLAGLAIGTVFGVPLGLALAQRWGWRAAIVLIVAVGGASLAGIALRGGELPAIPASGAGDRLRSIARPKNLLTVTVTLLTGVASLGLYTYMTVILSAGTLAAHQTLAIWVWGIGGAVGALGIGRLVDRRNPLRLSVIILVGLMCALLGMTQGQTAWIVLTSLFVWGMCGWASLTPQQHVLLQTNPADGATAVAANASANYLGSALGATFGSLLVAAQATPAVLCGSAAAVAALALICQLIRQRMSTTE